MSSRDDEQGFCPLPEQITNKALTSERLSEHEYSLILLLWKINASLYPVSILFIP